MSKKERKIKAIWKDLGREENRGIRVFFWSIVAIIIMVLLNFSFEEIMFFMALGGLIYSVSRIYTLKEEKEKLETENFELHTYVEYLEKETKNKRKKIKKK